MLTGVVLRSLLTASILLSAPCITASLGQVDGATDPPTEAHQPGGTQGGRSDIPALTSWVVGGPNLTDIWCTGLGWHDGVFWVCGSDFDGDENNGFGDN